MPIKVAIHHPNLLPWWQPKTHWFIDIGCNAHMTLDMANLTISNEYNSEERITVGNGQSAITHTG